METCDFRIACARQLMAAAHGRKPADLLPDDLVREITELHRCLAWAIDVVDDYAATDLDENVTQITLSGGLYVAPADVAALCGGCLRLLVSEQHPCHLASAGSAAAWQT